LWSLGLVVVFARVLRCLRLSARDDGGVAEVVSVTPAQREQGLEFRVCTHDGFMLALNMCTVKLMCLSQPAAYDAEPLRD
jgi:hypothetical protein